MKKINKNGKKGFTLVEMVLVIAIIVILAAVMVMNISDYINRARNAASSMVDHNNSVKSVVGEIDRQAFGS